MKKLSYKEQERLDTDDRYLAELILEEMSKRLNLDEESLENEDLMEEEETSFLNIKKRLEKPDCAQTGSPITFRGI